MNPIAFERGAEAELAVDDARSLSEGRMVLLAR